ncbi:hypothetical protein HPB52_001862 [Rhipicephalus sanguineus]|uniref:Peptidase M13 N-terminal domain-containing protein n=1 Tax=Rhipicephalus sanguineus TaxID=34632 RepID=A0A9D4ST57_RHISA|nr:hypothetical protein HPB52_001862 [Rhipicephalus sanguineus]
MGYCSVAFRAIVGLFTQETQDGSARHGPAHVRPDDTKRLITITTLALAVVCAFTILSLLLPSTRPQGDVSRWCDTSDCRDFATLLTRELNRSVDPCHDFDAYVCSMWKPDDRFPRVFQTALDDLTIAWLDGLPELLEKGAKAASLAAKPLAMYSTCVKNSGVSVADKGWFLEFLSARKLSWPDRPRGGVRVSNVLVDLSMNWEMSLWMRVRVLKHPFTPGARRFLFLPGRRSDVRLFAALHKHVMSTGNYARYWGLIYHYFLGRQPGPEYEMTIKKSAEFQGDAVAILIQMAMLRSYTNASLIRISDASSTQGHADMWLEALRENAQSVTAGDDVLVANTAALFIVRDYVERHGDDVALMHLSWQFVQMYALALDKTLLEDVLGNGTYAANYLALLCAAQVEAVYNPVLAELYVPSRLTRKGETLADTLFGTLKRKAIDGVSRMSWLDGDAREFFKQQLASTVVRLWPPATMKNVLEVEEVYAGCPQGERSFVRFWISSRRCLSELLNGKRREDVSSMQPNFTPYLASYDSFENAVGIAVSALASPLYWMRGTPSMLYGGLGWFFTAFLLSPLDEHKQYVHPNGSFDVTGSWLSAQSAEALKQNKDCAAPARVSAIISLEIVHSVFMEHLRNSFQFNLTSELTEEKVFFMMLCRMLCAKKGSIWSLASCNGLLKHSKEFSRAFKCDASSTLIARKECQFLSP